QPIQSGLARPPIEQNHVPRSRRAVCDEMTGDDNLAPHASSTLYDSVLHLTHIRLAARRRVPGCLLVADAGGTPRAPGSRRALVARLLGDYRGDYRREGADGRARPARLPGNTAR